MTTLLNCIVQHVPVADLPEEILRTYLPGNQQWILDFKQKVEEIMSSKSHDCKSDYIPLRIEVTKKWYKLCGSRHCYMKVDHARNIYSPCGTKPIGTVNDVDALRDSILPEGLWLYPILLEKKRKRDEMRQRVIKSSKRVK